MVNPTSGKEMHKQLPTEVLRTVIGNSSKKLSVRYKAIVELKDRSLSDSDPDSDAARDVLIESVPTVNRMLSLEIIRFLGLMPNADIVALLLRILKTRSEVEMIRYTAAITLGRIGEMSVVPTVDEIWEDKTEPEFVREVCDVVSERLRWLLKREKVGQSVDEKSWGGFVDHEPAFDKSCGLTTSDLQTILFDESKWLFQRLRAMTSLRDKALSDDVEQASISLDVIHKALINRSTMITFRAEALLMQVANPKSIPELLSRLYDKAAHPAIRLEALDSVSFQKTSEWKIQILDYFMKDDDEFVRDMARLSLELETGGDEGD